MSLLMRPTPSVESLRRDHGAPHRHVDWSIVGLSVVLALIGLAAIFSATKGSDADPYTGLLVRQTVALLLGLLLMVVGAFFDYRKLQRWVVAIYPATLVLLAAVLVVGQDVKGAQAWFSVGPLQLQPSEPAKLALTVTLAAWLAARRARLNLVSFGVALLLAMAPMALILLQPDLGTMLVFVVVSLCLLAVAGVRARYLLALMVLGGLATVAVLNSDLLADYQRDRLLVFIDRASDGKELNDESYNVAQSETAISLGGVTGLGWGKGPQTQEGLVPEQQTDFIFTVVGEELGFLGAGTVLLLFLVLSLRVLRVAQLAQDEFGALLCCGVLAGVVFQVFENVGMSMRIMPVTGIPLPFLSYGGSSLLTTFAGMGLVLSVHTHRFR
ncbi:MAG: rod shape-determining protein RodA [Acidimicrobiales bacterium]